MPRKHSTSLPCVLPRCHALLPAAWQTQTPRPNAQRRSSSRRVASRRTAERVKKTFSGQIPLRRVQCRQRAVHCDQSQKSGIASLLVPDIAARQRRTSLGRGLAFRRRAPLLTRSSRSPAAMFKATLAIAPLAVLACSSSSSPGATKPPCNEDPWECPAGQTCWPSDPSGFQCLNSGPGTAGSACDNTLGAPTCGDGLACLQFTPPGLGTCLAYCDPTDPIHACPGGQTCQAILEGSGGTTLHVCTGAAAMGGGGGTPVVTPDAGTPTPITGDGGPSAPCTAWANHEVAQCPGTDPASTLATCADGDSLYTPIGCGSEWEAYVACATQATYACSNGPNGCDSQQSDYFACQSAFASATGCSRISGATQASCSGPTPYAFGCVGALPQACVPAPSSGSAATLGCCPQFPAR